MSLPVFTCQGVLQAHGQAAGIDEVDGGIPLFFDQEGDTLDGSSQKEGPRVVSSLPKKDGGKMEGGREGRVRWREGMEEGGREGKGGVEGRDGWDRGRGRGEKGKKGRR